MKAKYWIAAGLALTAWLPLAAAAEEAFTVRDTDVYAGPSSEYPPVGQLPVNAGVDVFGCLSDWSWCDVGFGPNRGWIYAGDIVVPYDNQRVAIIEYGPRIHLPLVTFSLVTYWDEHYRGQSWYGEREQWASRVHVEANRGGPPPSGHERAATVAPAAREPIPTRAAPAQAAESKAQSAQTRQAQTTRSSKQAQQQAKAQPTQRAQVAQSPKPEPSQQQAKAQPTRKAQVAKAPKPEAPQPQAKAQPTERQASTHVAQGEHPAQQPQRAQQAPKPEAAPKAETREEKPKEEH